MGAMRIHQGPVTRSSGNLPVGGHGSRGGPRRGRGGRPNGSYHQQTPHHEIKVPVTDFDFEASNKRFDKSSAAKHVQLINGPSSNAAPNGAAPASDTEDRSKPLTPVNGASAAPKEEGEVSDTSIPKESGDKLEKAYNPSKSFFDNISSDSKKLALSRAAPEEGDTAAKNTGEGARGRGRGRGRARRDEERERNVETFGEPGGVGMLGPGAYIGGYGGYRGKRRRGGGRGGHRGGGGGAPRVTVVGLV